MFLPLDTNFENDVGDDESKNSVAGNQTQHNENVDPNVVSILSTEERKAKMATSMEQVDESRTNSSPKANCPNPSQSYCLISMSTRYLGRS